LIVGWGKLPCPDEGDGSAIEYDIELRTDTELIKLLPGVFKCDVVKDDIIRRRLVSEDTIKDDVLPLVADTIRDDVFA